MSKSWLDIVATVAPSIATALGGPLAGMAVGQLGKALGLDDSSEESVSNAIISASPDDLLKMKEADLDFQKAMKAADIELVRISADDRNSARQRQIAVKDKIPGILAFAVTTGFFGVLTFMLLRDVPTSSKDVLNIMLGALGTAWIQVMGFYFGSSSGSEKKNEIIASLKK
jgi:hypothetical protein